MSDTWIIGAWRVDFRQGSIKKRWQPFVAPKTVDSRLLEVLRTLVAHPGSVVSADTLLEKAWSDRVVSRDSVTTAIYQLRQALEDSTENPKYIRSEARRGYRLVASTRRVSNSKRRHLAATAAASMVAVVAYASTHYMDHRDKPTLYVEPLINYAESPIQEPLFTAVENTFLSEIIQRVPGGVLASGDGAHLKLQTMLVACDLGPTLVTRLLDTRSETFIWSNTYNLEKMDEDPNGPTLVVKARDRRERSGCPELVICRVDEKDCLQEIYSSA